MTTYLGLNTIAAASPDYEGGASSIALLSANMALLDVKSSVEVEAASGAIGIKEGKAYITKAGIAALTLVAPTAGLPAAGGDDGKTLTIIATTAYAHTVTTPANAINGSLHVATFGGAIGNSFAVSAYNGTWWQVPSSSVTLS